jgi:hypothetical protein
MPSNDKAGLKQAFAHLRRPDEDEAAERKLLGRTIETAEQQTPEVSIYQAVTEASYQVATSQPVAMAAASGGLTPRPLLQREAEKQLSFRCPVSLAAELQRKARFNQLEQQQILKESLRRVLAELADPPEGWIG